MPMRGRALRPIALNVEQAVVAVAGRRRERRIKSGSPNHPNRQAVAMAGDQCSVAKRHRLIEVLGTGPRVATSLPRIDHFSPKIQIVLVASAEDDRLRSISCSTGDTGLILVVEARRTKCFTG